MSPPRGPHIHGAYTPPPAEQPLQWSARDSGDGRESRDSAGESRETPPTRPPLRRVTATHSHGAYDSGDGCDSTVGDGDSSPRSPFTPTRPTSISVISELDTIQSEVWSPSEEPSSPHSPSPISVTNLLDDSAPRAPRKLDHYYAAPTRSTSCCVVA